MKPILIYMIGIVAVSTALIVLHGCTLDVSGVQFNASILTYQDGNADRSFSNIPEKEDK